MTVEVEVQDEKGLALLRQLETFNVLKLKDLRQQSFENIKAEPETDETVANNNRLEKIRSLQGSLNMGPERIKEFEAYLQEIRNELERPIY